MTIFTLRTPPKTPESGAPPAPPALPSKERFHMRDLLTPLTTTKPTHDLGLSRLPKSQLRDFAPFRAVDLTPVVELIDSDEELTPVSFDLESTLSDSARTSPSVSMDDESPLSIASISPVPPEAPPVMHGAGDYRHMRTFASEHETISPEDLDALLLQGKAISSVLCSGSESAILALEPTENNCRALIWFLLASSFEAIEAPFTRGVTRIVGPSAENIFNFLARNPSSYNRISSHFTDMTVGYQKGIDFEEGRLYERELKTTLFGKLSDGSVFIKCEREGTNILRDPIGTMLHLRNWAAKAMFGRNPTEGGLATRRESDRQSILKEAFHSVLASVKEADRVTGDSSLTVHTDKTLAGFKRTFQRVAVVKNIKAALYEGRDPATIEANATLKKLAEDIAAFEEIASTIPRADVISGHEVLLDASSFLPRPTAV